jgi:hypothetical protein
MTQKAIIFDASSLISFSMNGLFDELRKLKEIFNGKFIITKEVKKEVIDDPIKGKRFKLEAMKVQELLNEKVLEMPVSFGIKDEKITARSKEILEKVNSAFFGGNRYIHMLDWGEVSCLALGEMLTKKGIQNVLAIDERTTRVLVERPENLKKLYEKKLHVQIEVKNENLAEFRNLKIIRSTELAYVLWKKKLIKLQNGEVLDGLLYAMKLRGAAISDEEIKEIKSMK